MTALPETLNGLTPREAVVDAVYRLVNSFDLSTRELLDNSITDDCVMVLGKMRTMEGREAIMKECYDPVSKLDTTHFLTNLRTELYPDGKTAHVTCNATARHLKAGSGLDPDHKHFTSGGNYNIDLVKDEKTGLWKAKLWSVHLVWLEGDRSVME